MLDWLRRSLDDQPEIALAGQTLPVTIRRLSNAKRLTMRLAPDGSEVRISMPRWTATGEAMAFVRARADWIEAQLAALPRPEPVGPGGTLSFRGEALQIEHVASAPRKPVLADSKIRLGGPAETVPARLRRWLESEAKRLSTDDLAHYCMLAEKPAPRLGLSNARRRWGSCAPDGSIRINWRLIMAPDAVRRSVVAHEVAHLVHFDHSPRFHALLRELFEGDIKDANRWLKREGRSLYAAFG